MTISLMVVLTKAQDDYSGEDDENYQDNMVLDSAPPYDGPPTTTNPAPSTDDDDYYYADLGTALDSRGSGSSCKGKLKFGRNGNKKM